MQAENAIRREFRAWQLSAVPLRFSRVVDIDPR